MTNTGDRSKEQPYDDLYRKGNSQGPSLVHHFSFSDLKLKLIKIYEDDYLTPTRQLSSRPSAVWDCPVDNVCMSIYDTWPLQSQACLPILSASFCNLYLPPKYTLTETSRGIHFFEDWNGVSRKTLGITYAIIFKTNLGSPILEYWSEHYPHPPSLLLASCSCWPNVVTDTKLLLSPRSTMSQKWDSSYKVAEKNIKSFFLWYIWLTKKLIFSLSWRL